MTAENHPRFDRKSEVSCRALRDPLQLAHRGIQGGSLRPRQVRHVAQPAVEQEGLPHPRIACVGHEAAEPAPASAQNPLLSFALPFGVYAKTA